MITVIFAQLVPKLAKVAPHVSFEFVQPSEAMTTQFEKGELDEAIIPEYFASLSHPFERLYDENHVVAGWSENPALSEGRCVQYSHIVRPADGATIAVILGGAVVLRLFGVLADVTGSLVIALSLSFAFVVFCGPT